MPWTPHEGGWERFAAAVDALPRLIPDEVLTGFHLCYGTFPEWPMYEARDMAVLVRMANYAAPRPAARSTGCTWPARASCAGRTSGSSAR